MPADLVISEQAAPYLAQFERISPGAGRLRELRQTAIDRFVELGFPTAREEDWKFTSLAPLARTRFDLAGPADVQELLAQLPPDDHRIVFVNGRHVPALSTLSSGTGTLVTAPPAVLERHLARYANYRKHAFVALNTAFLEDGVFVHVPNGVVLDTPIHMIHVSVAGARPTVSHPRNLILIGSGSHASVIETYLGDGEYFTNAVTEIVVGEGSVVGHCKFQEESAQAFHISTLQIEQSRGSVFASRSIAFGGAIARTEINAVLEEGSECTLNGLYIGDGRRHIDTRTSIDHAKPHAASHETYKGILDGHSSAVFNGKIIVRKDAQKTDAKQTNKNLLLSEDATINTKPQLEILADDVRCTHGATIGQLDAESIFYLRSRGIGAQAARAMLIEAFAREVVDGIQSEPFRDFVERRLHGHLG
jgi:Fe-S cluster assembly protein SufD